ncbi:MAG: hypothetical protein ACKO2L_09935 [Planctomycetaceae bacterium]
MQISNGRFGGVFYKGDTANTDAFDAQGDVELINIPGIILEDSLAARVNTTGGAVNETITVPGFDPVQLLFAETDLDPVFSGTIVNAEIAEFASVSGWFSVTNSSDRPTIAASDINAFVSAGDSGISVTDGKLGAVVDTATGSFALVASGAVESQNITGLKVTGDDGTVRINLLGRGITETITTPAGDVVLDFADGDQLLRLEGPVSIEVAGFVDIDADIVVEKRISGDTTSLLVQATDASAFLGTGSTTEDTADASGHAALKNIPGLDLEGDLSARINTTGGAVNERIPVPGGDPVDVIFAANEGAAVFSGTVTVEAAGFASLTGSFSISKSTDRVRIPAAGVEAFVGAGDMGVKLTNASLGIIANTASKKFALVADGLISLEGFDDFDLQGAAQIRINRLGVPITETVTTPAGPVTLMFPTGDPVLLVAGSVSLGIGDFFDTSADLSVQKQTDGDVTHLHVQALNVTAFLGTGASTTTTADDFGVRLKNGAMVLRWVRNTATDTFYYYAFNARGTAELVGITDLTLEGSLEAARNTGPNTVTLEFGTAATDDDFVLAPGTKRFGVSGKIGFGDFIEVSAAFGFEEGTATVNGVETTRILVAAAGITTFLGSGRGTDDELGIPLSDGQIGAVIDKPASGGTKYALVAQGTASLVGVDGLTLTGTLHARLNRLGSAIETNINTPAGPGLMKRSSQGCSILLRLRGCSGSSLCIGSPPLRGKRFGQMCCQPRLHLLHRNPGEVVPNRFCGRMFGQGGDRRK